jgi:hypothetical protein
MVCGIKLDIQAPFPYSPHKKEVLINYFTLKQFEFIVFCNLNICLVVNVLVRQVHVSYFTYHQGWIYLESKKGNKF